MKIFRILSVILLVNSTTFNSQTIVGGMISSNTIWTKINSPYIVANTVTIQPGVWLTIEPGVTVRFQQDQGIESIEGGIFAEGTIADSIFFLVDMIQNTSKNSYIKLDASDCSGIFILNNLYLAKQNFSCVPLRAQNLISPKRIAEWR